MKTVNEIVIGDKLYIPGVMYISRGEDDIAGGIATVKKIKEDNNLPKNHTNKYFAEFEEIPNRSFNLTMLLRRQEELSKKYAGEIAKPDPDINTPWIQNGDIVNGRVWDDGDRF